jgi:hypothetical protein
MPHPGFLIVNFGEKRSMKLYIFCSVALFILSGANGVASAKESDVVLLSITPHPATETAHVCKIVKADAKNNSDCDDPKCASGGAAVDAALASKNMKRICKRITASVNRGYDVTYALDGAKFVTWTYPDPEPNLRKIGLVPFEEHTPLNPLCGQMSFKEASVRVECTELK